MEQRKKHFTTRAPKPRLPLQTGRKPVLEALHGSVTIEKIFILRSATGQEINEIKHLAREKNIPLSLVPIEKLNHLTTTQHQGVIAVTGVINYIEFQTAIDFVVSKGETPLFLLLDGVTDIRNIGAIARSALCLGAQAIVLPTSNSAMLNEEAVKSSAGALSKILICRIPSTPQAIDLCKLNGIQIIGTMMKGDTPVYKCNYTLPSLIIMGAEGNGISKDVIKRADNLIHIPMANNFDSLNVSVACGIILYEANKQRLTQ